MEILGTIITIGYLIFMVWLLFCLVGYVIEMNRNANDFTDEVAKEYWDEYWEEEDDTR